MPTFVMVGRLDKNLSGNTSKGYVITRSGKSVSVKWGAIVCKTRKYYWAGRNWPQIKIRKLKTEEEAIWLFKDRAREKIAEGYSKLRSDSRIYSFAKLK